MEDNLREIPFQPSTIEGIDETLFEWLRDTADVRCTTADGFKKVPTLWISAERPFQRKHNQDLMTSSGSLNLPIITLQRDGISKDNAKKGSIWGNMPAVADAKGGSIVIARKINQIKTSNFANADAKRTYGQMNYRNRRKNKKVVYQTISIPQPVYIEISYKITLISQYQQQINEMVTPFITKPGNMNYFVLNKDGHSYEVFPDTDYSQDNTVEDMSSEERRYKTTIGLKVLAYLIGEDKNQETPKFVVRENAVEVKIPREHVVLGDPLEQIDKKGSYRE
jgi:hypothetical protein